ncbi:hypothetical protein TEA_014440 [Camellia sinensis var. sinensis]|uniref:protein-synthesizing GTPase n=1 Tax=Camellia sinensis var. sinensis TaxID=542762 RepID=A0A4S4DWR5_CAMSN|nr:hypothetical protein TEA_014440 [Camellia sinensis var. sinensis]
MLPYKYRVLPGYAYRYGVQLHAYRVRQKRTGYVLYGQYTDGYAMGTFLGTPGTKSLGIAKMSRKGLMEQDLSKLDVAKLNPLSPEVISRQATINIGTIGHVAHGKSTVVKAISGVQTVRFKNELERNITIKLGYANAKIYKCEDDRCPRPMCYKAYGSGKEDNPMCDVPGFENCRMKLLRHVSFVDCPGHDILMATMLNGAAIMDGALLLIAANESCPQPQTSEHLAAVEIMRLQHIIILQNKVDLIQENVAINQHEAIQKFIQGTVADGAPVIPVSAQLKYNIDVVCEYIVKKIPIPERNFISPPNMIVIRSFDVNKPGFEVDEIKGGVAGGSILKGVLKVNQYIEVRPGIVVKDESGNIKCTPIYSRIVSLYAEQNELQFAVPGGLIGVGTTMDPTLTRADRLVGQVLGEVGSLPEVFVELEVNFFLLRRLLGVRTKGTERQGKVSKLAKAEILMLNIGSMSTGARVVAVKNDVAKLQLTSPVCTSKGEKIALSRRVEKHWRLIGWGQIQGGLTLDVPPCPIISDASGQLVKRCVLRIKLIGWAYRLVGMTYTLVFAVLMFPPLDEDESDIPLIFCRSSSRRRSLLFIASYDLSHVSLYCQLRLKRFFESKESIQEFRTLHHIPDDVVVHLPLDGNDIVEGSEEWILLPLMDIINGGV